MIGSGFSPWPCFTEKEAEAVKSVLLSNKVNYWTGSECKEFEKEFAAWAGVGHAIALANGTLALDLALKAIEAGEGDEVIVTPRTFIASASSIANAGAIPVFADVCPDSQNITAESIGEVITPRTKAVIAVHLAGWPCDMDRIRALCDQHKLFLIEDCAQAHGARYKGRSVGSLGHIGCWSFCQDKIMTTGGEGGMVTTDSRDMWSKMWSYKDHGKCWETVFKTRHPPGFRWLHESFGTNWRMTEMQAVIGRIQLGKMQEWTSKRIKNSSILDEKCTRINALHVPRIPNNIVHARYKYYVFIKSELLNKGWDRDLVISEIENRGVPCFQGGCSEVYLEKAFDSTGFRPAQRLPVARQLGETSLMFLVHPTLRKDELHKTGEVLQSVMSEASVDDGAGS